jgi:hypothetical protein
MYRLRAFDFVTVSTDAEADKAAVTDFLQKQYASGPNLIATVDHNGVQAAFGEKWKPNTLFTAVIDADGKLLYKKEGKLALQDLLVLRRNVLARMPDTAGYPGNRAYWEEDLKSR